MPSPSLPTAEDLAGALTALREQSPLTQCLTNIVVAGWTANVLIAAGAAPAMVDNAHEAGEFAEVAGCVLINLGTPYDDTTEAMSLAAAAAHERGTPWVLDPVAVGGLTWRTELAHRLVLDYEPTIIRGNASEISALVGGAGGRGVDATTTAEAVLDGARDLTTRHRSVVAVGGPVDHITDGNVVVRVGNGHEWLTKVTGVGCALGALMASYAAVVDPLVAATAATAHLTVAADVAAARSAGPGSFAVALLDEIASLSPKTLAAQADLR